MPQVAWADRLTLPPDSTGKPTGMVPVAVTGGTLYLPASVMVDAAGNTIDSATAAPAGTERGLITRNIPSGTQPVSLAAAVSIGAGAATIGTVLNVGDVDHDAVNTGKVVQTGGHASYPAIPSSVSADGDRVRQWQDRAGAQIVRKRPVAMYTAQYRLANATAGNRMVTTPALTANTNKQIATIHHAASATKRVQIKFVSVNVYGVSVAGVTELELVTLSATTPPATGAPAVTPGKHDQADAAAEATCLTLPGTAGSVGNADQPVGDNWAENIGVTGAGSTAHPPPPATKAVLWDSRDIADGKDLIIRAGVAEGYAINVRHGSNASFTYTATIVFTEEA